MRAEPLYYQNEGYPIPRTLPIDAPITELWNPVTYLTDVNSLFFYQIGQKKYFFFGDQHFAKSEGGCEEKLNLKCDDYNGNFSDSRYYGTACTSIGILLHNWFLFNNDHKIRTDFYLELSFTNDNEREQLRHYLDVLNEIKVSRQANDKNYDFEDTSWLQLLALVMNDCFLKDKRLCPYSPYVHAHYADIRSLDTKDENLIADPFLLLDLKPYLDKTLQRIRTTEQLEELRDELSVVLSIIISDYRDIIDGILSPTDFDIFIKRYNNLSGSFSGYIEDFYLSKFNNMRKISVIRDGVRMHKVAAELQRLRNENDFMATLIEEFIYEKADHYIKDIKVLFDQILNIFDEERLSFHELGQLVIESFDTLLKALVPMSALSMDCYLLARMFLQHGSDEIIVYAGAAHIDHYADFFEHYLGVKRLAGIESQFDNRCLHLVTLPKYLDANKYRKYAVNKKYKATLDWFTYRGR